MLMHMEFEQVLWILYQYMWYWHISHIHIILQFITIIYLYIIIYRYTCLCVCSIPFVYCRFTHFDPAKKNRRKQVVSPLRLSHLQQLKILRPCTKHDPQNGKIKSIQKGPKSKKGYYNSADFTNWMVLGDSCPSSNMLRSHPRLRIFTPTDSAKSAPQTFWQKCRDLCGFHMDILGKESCTHCYMLMYILYIYTFIMGIDPRM